MVEAISLRLLLILITGFAIATIMAVSVLGLSHHIPHYFSENYKWRVVNSLNSGNLNRAQEIATKQVQAEYYDFEAHRLLASTLLAQGRTTDSVNLLLESYDRTRTAEHRSVYTRGLSKAATLELLSYALKQQGRDSFSDEISRILYDESAVKSLPTTDDETSTAPHMAKADIELIRWVDLDNIELKKGVQRSSGSLEFVSGVSLPVTVPIGRTRPTEICFEVKGGKVMGVGGILKVRNGDTVIGYLYGDQPSRHVVCFSVTSEAIVAENLQLKLDFVNDAFDPITRADRNMELLRIGWL